MIDSDYCVSLIRHENGFFDFDIFSFIKIRWEWGNVEFLQKTVALRLDYVNELVCSKAENIVTDEYFFVELCKTDGSVTRRV